MKNDDESVPPKSARQAYRPTPITSAARGVAASPPSISKEQRLERAEEHAEVMLGFVKRRYLPIEIEQGKNRGLGRTDGVFDREHDVVGNLARLPDED